MYVHSLRKNDNYIYRPAQMLEANSTSKNFPTIGRTYIFWSAMNPAFDVGYAAKINSSASIFNKLNPLSLSRTCAGA